MNRVSIEARNIEFAYGVKAVLRDINFRIDAGELFAVLGPSGSGKTTLLRLLAGLEIPTVGSIQSNQVDVFDIAPAQRSVGMVFQSFSLWPHMTVFENVAFGIVDRHVGDAERNRRVGKMLDLLNIAPARDCHPDALSVGEQQRVALARALVTEPSLLLLDDPFSNLEYELRVQMRQDVRRLQRRLGITTVFVTHDREDAMSIADRVAVVANGTLQQIGTPEAIYDFPRSIDVARFVGVTNFIPGAITYIDDQRIDFASTDIGSHSWFNPMVREPSAPGHAVLGIRPHALHIAPIDSFRDGRYVWFSGIIKTSEFLGEVIRYQVDVGDLCISVNQAHFAGSTVTPAATQVLVGFDPIRARVFSSVVDGTSAMAHD